MDVRGPARQRRADVDTKLPGPTCRMCVFSSLSVQTGYVSSSQTLLLAVLAVTCLTLLSIV